MRDRVKERVAEVRVSCCLNRSVGFLRKRVEEKRCSESVSTTTEKPAEQTRWLERGACRSKHCSVEKMTVWTENVEKTGWKRQEMDSPALWWPMVEAIRMQRKNCFR